MATPLSSGVWGVLATPFQGSALDLCETSLERETQHYAKVGVTGLTVLGVFGESANLTAVEQREVLDTVVAVKGDLPIVVGVPGKATHTVIEQADNATSVTEEIAGLMVQVNTGDPHALLRHLTAVHDATGLPLVVQDYPLVTGVKIDQRNLARVVNDLGEAVVGIKSEAPPTPPAIATLTAAVSVPVFGGLGGVGLLDELAAGAAGAMTGFSFPEALVQCVQAFADGGLEAAREVYAPWLPLANFESQAGISLAVRKEVLRSRGLMLEAGVRAPALPFPDSLHSTLDSHVADAERRLAAQLQVA
jgi:4-hydroxy-tetrahydrodipicolinate synthase